jgi:hypothetical protein
MSTAEPKARPGKSRQLDRLTLLTSSVIELLLAASEDTGKHAKAREVARKLRRLKVDWSVITEATGVKPTDLRSNVKS